MHNSHIPTDENRTIVRELYAAGICQERIAERLDIDPKTLRLHYRDELDNTKENMISALSKNLYQDALNGDKDSREFWLKCQGRWSYYKPPEQDKSAQVVTLLESIVDKLS